MRIEYERIGPVTCPDCGNALFSAVRHSDAVILKCDRCYRMLVMLLAHKATSPQAKDAHP